MAKAGMKTARRDTLSPERAIDDGAQHRPAAGCRGQQPERDGAVVDLLGQERQATVKTAIEQVRDHDRPHDREDQPVPANEGQAGLDIGEVAIGRMVVGRARGSGMATETIPPRRRRSARRSRARRLDRRPRSGRRPAAPRSGASRARPPGSRRWPGRSGPRPAWPDPGSAPRGPCRRANRAARRGRRGPAGAGS